MVRWLRGRRTPEQAFADEVGRLVPRLVAVQRVEHDDDDFSLRITQPDGTVVVMFLHNLFAEAAPLDDEARTDRIRRAILAVHGPARPTTWAAAGPKVLPAVRAASVAAAYTSGGIVPIRSLLAPFVVRLVALDEEHGLSFVSEEDVGTWGVEADIVGALAEENLLAGGAPVGAAPGGGWVEVLGPDGYASSWLTVPRALDQLAEDLGDYVAVARSRDSLRLVSTADAAALRQILHEELAAYQEEPRRLSPVPYAVRDGGLTPWEPPRAHPCRDVVDEAQQVLAATEYGYQQAVLEDLFEKAGEDVHVATLNLVQRPDGSVWSWAAWVAQVTDGLLPRCDHIGLIENDHEVATWVRWEDALRVGGAAIQPEPGSYPPRWRVHGWPAAAALAELRRLAVDP
jgi:hypothetical protein